MFNFFCLAEGYVKLLAVSFDWNLITSENLYTPLWTQLNQDIGVVLTYILMCAVYYGNIWQGLKVSLYVLSLSSG